MERPPALPGRPDHRPLDQRLAAVRPLDADGEHLRKPGVGIAVEHDEIAVHQPARHPELRLRALERDRRAGERAVGHGESEVAHDVVDDLVPDQDALWVGTGDAVLDQPEDDVTAVEEAVGLLGLPETRVVDRRDPVLGRAARHHRVAIDLRLPRQQPPVGQRRIGSHGGRQRHCAQRRPGAEGRGASDQAAPGDVTVGHRSLRWLVGGSSRDGRCGAVRPRAASRVEIGSHQRQYRLPHPRVTAREGRRAARARRGRIWSRA